MNVVILNNIINHIIIPVIIVIEINLVNFVVIPLEKITIIVIEHENFNVIITIIVINPDIILVIFQNKKEIIHKKENLISPDIIIENQHKSIVTSHQIEILHIIVIVNIVIIITDLILIITDNVIPIIVLIILVNVIPDSKNIVQLVVIKNYNKLVLIMNKIVVKLKNKLII